MKNQSQDLPARELFAKSRRELGTRVQHTKKCGFGHRMMKLEPGAWYCGDRECEVLAVFAHYPGLYQLHCGSDFIYFNHDEAESYLQGNQSLVDLVATVL